MKQTLRTLHRTISIAFALIWVVQAISGTILSFQREIDDLSIPPATQQAADFQAVDRALTQLLDEQPGSHIPFVYTHDGDFNRFDVFIVDANDSYSLLLMDSDGTILRTLPSNPEVMDAGFFEQVLELHAKLWAGNTGHIFIGISGLLLISNLIMGLVLAWPRRGQWQQSLRFPKIKSGKTGFYGMHRALGLMFVVPALFIFGAGTLIVWEDTVADFLGVEKLSPNIPAVESFTGAEIRLPEAVAAAKARFPGVEVSMFTVASPEAPYYRIRLLQAGELRTILGKTTVYVSALDGSILAAEDALTAPLATRFINAFYPVHTGEVLGITGRVIAFVVGLWLLTMVFLGLRLWWLRR